MLQLDICALPHVFLATSPRRYQAPLLCMTRAPFPTAHHVCASFPPASPAFGVRIGSNSTTTTCSSSSRRKVQGQCSEGAARLTSHPGSPCKHLHRLFSVWAVGQCCGSPQPRPSECGRCFPGSVPQLQSLCAGAVGSSIFVVHDSSTISKCTPCLRIISASKPSVWGKDRFELHHHHLFLLSRRKVQVQCCVNATRVSRQRLAQHVARDISFHFAVRGRALRTFVLCRTFSKPLARGVIKHLYFFLAASPRRYQASLLCMTRAPFPTAHHVCASYPPASPAFGVRIGSNSTTVHS